MGLGCPVCEQPEADAEHLAHHMAMTAIMGDEAHAAFLDDQVPTWESCDPTTLGEELEAHATATDHEPVSTPDAEGAELASDGATGRPKIDRSAAGTAEDDTVEAILEQARAYTAEMYGSDTAQDENEAENE